MGIQLTKIDPENTLGLLILEIRISGKLMEADYEVLVAEIDVLAQGGEIRIFVELVDFFGWTAGVLWENTKFAARTFGDVERIAIVGDKYWARGMAGFCKPFIEAKWRYYDSAIIEEGRKWIHQKKDENERLFH